MPFFVFLWFVCLFTKKNTQKKHKTTAVPLNRTRGWAVGKKNCFFSCFVVCFLLVGQKGYSARRGQTQYLDCVFTDFGNFSWIPKTGWPLVGNEGMNPHHNHV